MKTEKVVFSFQHLLNSVDLHELGVMEDMIDVRRSFMNCKSIEGHMLYVDKAMQETMMFSEDKFLFHDTFFICPVFEELKGSLLESTCFYLLTHLDKSANIYINELSYHIVENKCLEIARNAVFHNFMKRTESGNNNEIWYTKAFGPGYYGMELSEGRKMYELLEGEKLGVMYQNELLIPMKSCIGVYFSFQGKDKVELSPCKYCVASKEQCTFCGGL